MASDKLSIEIKLADIEAVNDYIMTLHRCLAILVNISKEASDDWDQDKDMRTGKLLIAMSGRARGYRKDIDEVHDIIKNGNPIDKIRLPKTTLTDGKPVTPDHREIITSGPRAGQQKAYVVLSDEERAKGFVRHVRRSYVHSGNKNADPDSPAYKGCGTVTTMGHTIAETYARDPKFYSGTFCCVCGTHRPLVEFVWEGTDETVGS